MTGIIIRKVEDSDRDAIISIFNYYVKEGFSTYPDTPVPPGFFNMLIEGSHTCFIIEKNGKEVGFSILRPLLPFPAFAKTATISTFIEHSSRNQGFGKKLLEHVENEAKSREMVLLLANISSKNQESLNFHVKYGFLECGRFHKAGIKFNTPFDLVWMEKELV
jgi:L-amino acid N-acyltransferase YncA